MNENLGGIIKLLAREMRRVGVPVRDFQETI